ncbi:MAG: hypothetical protein Q8R20_01045 [Nanoarchaeota archaeon]|nr:hypothetical protein [Nanoarchaeota archaeon]
MRKYTHTYLRTEEGLTLLEVLLYSAILAIFLSAAFLAVQQMFSFRAALESRHEMIANEELVGERLQWIMLQASRIEEPAPGATSSLLRIATFQSSTSPAVFSFSDGQIFLSLASSTARALTNNRVLIEGFEANHVSSAAVSSTLEVRIRLRDRARSGATSSIIYTFPIF